MLEGLAKALFFLAQDIDHPLFGLAQLGISIAHRLDQIGHQAVKEGPALTQLVTMAQGATRDATQHIAAALAARNHPIDDQERAGADMVGNDTQRRRRQIGDAGLACGGCNQLLKKIDLVIAVHALQHCGDALQAHAGVDAGPRQGRELARDIAFELHEDQVPDLDVAITVFVGTAGRAAGNIRAVIEKDLGTRAAGAGIGHLPEIVRGITRALVVTDANDALGGHANLIGPNAISLIVLGVDRDPEPLGGQLVNLGQQLPGEANRVLLEIVAEGKIAEHLEEGVMPGGVADILEIVVLAAGTHAALRGGGAFVRALLLAQKHILELDHAAVGEQQGRIIRRYE